MRKSPETSARKPRPAAGDVEHRGRLGDGRQPRQQQAAVHRKPRRLDGGDGQCELPDGSRHCARAIGLQPGERTLTFQPGVQSQTIAVTVKADRTREPDETLTVELLNAVGATVNDAAATGTILNDDGAKGPAVGGRGLPALLPRGHRMKMIRIRMARSAWARGMTPGLQE